MLLRKKIQKIVSTLALFFVCFGMFGAMTASASTWGEIGAGINDLFSTEEEGLSFTDFKGGMGTLPPGELDDYIARNDDFREFVVNIVNFALSFLGLLAVLIVIYGGVLYVTSAGEEEATQKGKKAITFAAIGLLIVLGSYAFVNTIIGGATGTGGTTGTTVVGVTSGVEFNASSEQVRTLALEIIDGYAFLAEATEEIKNIQNDARKSSLSPINYPSKAEIVNYLRDVKNKIGRMKSKVGAFSESVAAINELIRQIDRNIDSISSLTSTARLNVEELTLRPNGFSTYKDNICTSDGNFKDNLVGRDPCAGYAEYTVGLADKWSTIQNDMFDVEGQIASIITPIKNDYASGLREIFLKIDTTYKGLANIEAIGGTNTRSKVAYESMRAEYFGYAADNPESSISGKFLDDIDTWTTLTSIEATGNKMLGGLEELAVLYDEFKTLKYVKARLTADTVSGSAPLTVIFDALATNDPAGGSLKAENIIWDPAGTLTLVELQENGDYSTIIEADANGEIRDLVDCSITGTPAEQGELLAATSQRCRFEKPGTYQAAVKIKSNDEGEFAPGISVLIITVRPPTTKIDLTVQQEGIAETMQVVSRYEGDLLIADKKKITFTLEQASKGAGILFDATNTDAERFKWTFSDGDSTNYETEGVYERNFNKTGKYEATLTVVNTLGAEDKKVFTIDISEVAARINVQGGTEAFVNAPIIFDGSASKSDNGGIASYSWTITPVDQTKWDSVVPANERDLPSEESGSTLSYKFKYPMEYNISLKVTDRNGDDSSADIVMEIQSQSPVAQFTNDIKDSTQPGTVHFNADTSYDPDGTDESLSYEWSVDANQDKWRFVQDTNSNSKKPIIKFTEKGSYDVTLKVSSLTADEEADEITKTITIDNDLDIAWASDQDVTEILGDDGKALMSFDIVSDKAIAYEIEFGDGEMSSGDIDGVKSISHTYLASGRYTVEVTVFDDDDNDNSIQRRIFIGGGDMPIAKIGIRINGVQIADLSEAVIINKRDVLTFDASESINLDGTGRKLNYSWDFGDTGISSNKTATHSYNEISPADPGYFTVQLRVFDDNDPSLTDEDEIKITVANEAPRFSSIQGVTKSSDLTTPVQIAMKVFGAEDPDGKITQYKWWYFDMKDPDEALGLQITTTDSAQLTIGTREEEGEETTYGFGLEIKDSDNLTFSSDEIFTLDTVPTLTVINGANDLPIAKFNVNATSVNTGETVVFTSASKDDDGTIVSYIWDFEGDGFFNNAPSDESSVEHVYDDKNLAGYDARLKVVDDKGGEAISDPIKIYVDSISEPPTAAFTYEVVEGSSGRKIDFINNSTADTETGARIINYSWDFDTESSLQNADSDGDGNKSNDKDSSSETPSRLYTEYGSYKVKLTVTDNQGNTDEVIRTIEIADPSAAAEADAPPVYAVPDGETEPALTIDGTSPTDPPSSDLIAIIKTTPAASADQSIYLPGESGIVTFDFSESQGLINYYIIDKNIYFDTDGNGIKDDDQDFKTTLPGRWSTNYEKVWGRAVTQLTIQDIYGNESTTLQEIKFE